MPWDTDGNGHSLEKTKTSGGLSGVAGFFVFMIVTGLICAVGGFVWTKVLDDSVKTQVVGTLKTAKDSVMTLIQGGAKPRGGFSDMREGFEPLAEADVAD